MKWSNIWSYTQQDYRSWPSEIEKQLQVVRIRSNHHSTSLKIRFSNEYGEEDLVFEKVNVRVIEPSTLKTSETKIVTLNGREKISIFPTVNLISDEVNLEICPGSIIEITTRLRQKTILRSGTVSYSKAGIEVYNYQLNGEDKIFIEQEKLFRMVKENNRMFYIYGISGVDILANDETRTIVAFGDSITQQGFWVEPLKIRLFEEKFHEVTVLNRGIGGSRILKGQNPENDSYTRHGMAGLFRFEKEVFMYGKVDVVICLHGINDLISRHDGTKEYPYTVEDIKDGLIQYAETAHHHNVKIIMGTLAPMGGSIFYSENLELERQEINEWIRDNDCFDGIIDFDKTLIEAGKENVLQETYDSGDGLHPSAKGGEKIAKIIELPYIKSIIHKQNKEEKDDEKEMASSGTCSIYDGNNANGM